VVTARVSASRPDVGIVTVETEGNNQDGAVVISFTWTVLVDRRGHGPGRARPEPRPEG
jgi:hypothetical protein